MKASWFNGCDVTQIKGWVYLRSFISIFKLGCVRLSLYEYGSNK